MSVSSVTQPSTGIDVDKPIRLVEFIFTCLTFLGILVGAYVSITNTNAQQDERIKNLETQSSRIYNQNDKILDKLETLTVIVAGKQDRKN